MDIRGIQNIIIRDLFLLSKEREWVTDNDHFAKAFFVVVRYNELLNKFEIKIDVFREYFSKWRKEYDKYLPVSEKILNKYFTDALYELFQNDKRLMFYPLRYDEHSTINFEFTIEFQLDKYLKLITDRYRFTI